MDSMSRIHILLVIISCGITGCAWELAQPEKLSHQPAPEPSPEAVYWAHKFGIRNDRFDFKFADDEGNWRPVMYIADGVVDAINRRTHSKVLAFSFKPDAFLPSLQSSSNATTNLLLQANALAMKYQGSNIVQVTEVHTHKRIFTKYNLDSPARKTEIEDSRDYLWIRTEFTGKKNSMDGHNPEERVEWILYVTDYNPDRLGEIDCPLVATALEMPLDISPVDRKHLTEVLEKSVRDITFYR
jgi:hypothetical protein